MLNTRARASIEVAPKKRQLGVVPPGAWGLVWCIPGKEERENSGSASLGESVVLEQDLDLEFGERWCLHKNEQGEALLK